MADIKMSESTIAKIVGKVVNKDKHEKVKEEFPIIAKEVRNPVVDKNGEYLGSIVLCEFKDRECIQYLSKEVIKHCGLSESNGGTPYEAEIVYSKKGKSMLFVSYAALVEPERANKLLREVIPELSAFKTYDDILKKMSYQSNMMMAWRCEACGREFKAIPNNRVGHTQTDCGCDSCKYRSSIGEELLALMLKQEIPNLKRQVPLWANNKNRKADMAFTLNGVNVIVEFDGAHYHDLMGRDIYRDKEVYDSKKYHTIRVIDMYNEFILEFIESNGKPIHIGDHTLAIPCDRCDGKSLEEGLTEVFPIVIDEINRLCKAELSSNVIITKQMVEKAAANRIVSRSKKIQYVNHAQSGT